MRHKTHREAGDSVVLYPDNYINVVEGEKLEDLCDHYIDLGFKRIVIDFSSTELINSIGISILIGIIEKVRERKGSVAFSGLKAVNYDIFNIVGLTKHIPVFKTDEEAVKEYGGHAAL
ncbi:MAG: STAS domain-containing protein [Deltaproteobacteria bacterium]|nr:STAS domain-containing protein [Deltaproteobacteria bacterium]